jgi:hypothetical protein
MDPLDLPPFPHPVKGGGGEGEGSLRSLHNRERRKYLIFVSK